MAGLTLRAVRSEAELAQPLRDATSGAQPNERTRRDGARFLKAVMSRSFDMREYSYQKPSVLPPAAIGDAAACLARGLRPVSAELAA